MKTKLKNSRYLVITGALAGLIACSASTHSEIKKSEDQLALLEANPDVVTYAPAALTDAKDAVDRAEENWKTNHDGAEAEHLTYLAGRRMEIALSEAAQKKAEVETNLLDRNRKSVRSAAREIELHQAHHDANVAEARANLSQYQVQQKNSEIAKLKEQLKDLEAREIPHGMQFTVQDVLFDTDAATLKPGAKLTLAPLAEYLKAHPKQSVSIEGHTDNTGTASYNQTLAADRALAVKNLLVDIGANGDRISTKGMGESFPRSSNDSNAGRLQNRRVEVIVKD